MTGLKAALLGTSAAVMTVCGAYAADPVQLDVEGEISTAVGIVDGDARADANAEVSVTGSTLLDNGIELGAIVSARLDGDQPRQQFAGGRYSSLLIGGPRGIAPLDSDAYLQGAAGYVKGPFGQIILGREQGIARTLAVTSPTIFRAVNVNNWQTDLSGINDVHTVNDFTGYSTKFTYMPPANFLGGALGGIAAGRILLTAALYYQHGIGRGSNRLFVGLGASYITADEDFQTASLAYEDYEAYALGLNLAYRGITLGGSVKTTNAGIASLEDDGYLAFDAGITFRTGEEKGDVALMLGYGQAEANVIGPNPLDPTLFRDTRTAQAGVSYVIGRGITVGAAAQYVESDTPVAAGGPEEAATVVIESSIKF
ncbi:Porin_4 domain-containing protein [Durusdinium trenchii]|uniref:Porin_4 domain-containing protein n=1 Tax=Durusdinium trenchii TaxID=1381693 RepID=A0ABP0LUS9_9DINO